MSESPWDSKPSTPLEDIRAMADAHDKRGPADLVMLSLKYRDMIDERGIIGPDGRLDFSDYEPTDWLDRIMVQQLQGVKVVGVDSFYDEGQE